VMEKMLGPAGSIYHKDCFACTSCGKRLEAGGYNENKDLPYCRECYGRMFGIKGFGFGGAVAQSSAPDTHRTDATAGVDTSSTFASVGGGAGYKTYSMRLKETKKP